ncbi:MAG: ribosomal-protein-alanine N-acetyltransferase [Candidatus Nanohaloarchaea archaeon]|jgi:ribosomal-protein-alanine N-acetyltransferase
MPGAVFLEGDQVNLRTIEEEDIEFLRNGLNNPEIRKFLTTRRPVNLEQEKDFFENVISSEDGVHLAICREEETIGITSIEEHSKDLQTAEIGLWIETDRHGNGYGSEAARLLTDYALKELNYHKIYARTDERNEASRKIWEKLGFKQEGKLREQSYANGEFKDILIFGILEHEWD